MQRIYSVSLTKNFFSETVILPQYDENYQLVFKFVNNEYKSSFDGKSAYFEGTRNDGLSFRYSTVVSGNTATFVIDRALTAINGEHKGQIVLYDNTGLRFGSSNVKILVEKAARSDNAIDADVTSQQTLLEQITSLAEQTEQAAEGVMDMTVSAQTLAQGADATVTKTEQGGVVNLAFGIPTGPQGATGATGATPNLTIGTVTTLEPDASATASITGTAEDPVLNLGIPRGQTGEVTEEEFTQLKEDLSYISSDNEIDVVSCGYTASDNKTLLENSAKYVSIMFPCVEGEVYTVNRLYGNRFAVLALATSPAVGVACRFLSSDRTITAYTFTATSDIKYVVVNLQNDYAGTQNTHEEILASCSVITHSAKDTTARSLANRAMATLNDLIVDVNKSNYWMIGGLGSEGEAYPTRNYNISTSTYMRNVISVVTDDGYATRYVLYNANKGFLFRSNFIKTELNVLDLLKTYNATYVKFEVEALDEGGTVITTPLEDVSRYSHVHLYTLRKSGIETEDITKWYQEPATQAELLDRIKQAKYVYSSSDAGVSSHPVLTLLHFSDVHANLSAMQYALDINDTFGSDIDDMLHTGDVVAANLSDGITNWISSGCADKVLNVIGNHDTEENLVLQAAGKDNVYNTIFAPYISNWGVTQPTGVDTSGADDYHALYYYKDYADAEVRLIVLDTNFWDDAQKSWLTSVLADAKTNGLCVVIACHDVKLLTEMTDSNFSSYKGDGITETSNAYANQPADWLDPVNDFINNGGSFACILAGHNHSGHIGTMTNYPNIFVYVIDKASVSRVPGTARRTGAKNANAVSIVVINPVEKLFKIVKIGAQTDGKMRPRNAFCYDFANHRIVSQW